MAVLARKLRHGASGAHQWPVSRRYHDWSMHPRRGLPSLRRATTRSVICARDRDLFVTLFLEAHAPATEAHHLHLDATDSPLHGIRRGDFHGYYIATAICLSTSSAADICWQPNCPLQHRCFGRCRRGGCAPGSADPVALAQREICLRADSALHAICLVASLTSLLALCNPSCPTLLPSHRFSSLTLKLPHTYFKLLPNNQSSLHLHISLLTHTSHTTLQWMRGEVSGAWNLWTHCDYSRWLISLSEGARVNVQPRSLRFLV